MRSLFPGHYPQSDDERDRVWRVGLVILDTNVLLNLHRFNRDTRDAFFIALERFGDRLWLPNEVAAEYQRTWHSVPFEQRKSFEEILVDLEKRATYPESINKIRQNSSLDRTRVKLAWDGAIDAVRSLVAEGIEIENMRIAAAEHEDTHARLTELFEGRVGEPFANETLVSRRAEAARRIEAQIPPGYRDRGKADGGVGDVLIWFQILERAAALSLPVIFVTDDAKEDWWHRPHGQALGPRPELFVEFDNEVGAPVLFYSSQRFLEHAAAADSGEPIAAVLEEVRAVSEDSARLEAVSLNEPSQVRRELERDARLQRRLFFRVAAVPNVRELEADLEQVELELTVVDFEELAGRQELPVGYRRSLIGERDELRSIVAAHRARIDQFHRLQNGPSRPRLPPSALEALFKGALDDSESDESVKSDDARHDLDT